MVNLFDGLGKSITKRTWFVLGGGLVLAAALLVAGEKKFEWIPDVKRLRALTCGDYTSHRGDPKVQEISFPEGSLPNVDRREAIAVFISYSRRDSEFVDRLIPELEDRGFDVWIDRQDIRGGSAWRASISQAMRQCRAVVFVLSPRSAASDNVAKELSLADDHKRPIVPISFEPCPIPAALDFQLAGLQIVDFTQAGFSDSVNQLVQALHALIPATRTPALQGAVSRADPTPNAYWLVTAVLLMTGLVIGLARIGLFDGLAGREGTAPKSPDSSADTAPCAASPNTTSDVVAYEILAVQLDPDSLNQQTVRFSIRLTVSGQTGGMVATPFAGSWTDRVLTPTKKSA